MRHRKKSTIKNTTWIVNTKISNITHEDQFMMFGYHPAFLIDNDSTIEVQPNIMPEIINNKGRNTKEKLNIDNIKIANLQWGVFDTLIFENRKVQKITLHNKNYSLVITHNANSVQLWKKPSDNFLAIEPWFGTSDTQYNSPAEVSKKRNVVKIKPGKSFDFTIKIQYKKNSNKTKA